MPARAHRLTSAVARIARRDHAARADLERRAAAIGSAAEPDSAPPARRRRGPDPVPPELRRVASVTAWLNAAEVAHLDAEIAACGARVSRADWLRRGWLRDRAVASIPENRVAANAELARTAANLTQLRGHASVAAVRLHGIDDLDESLARLRLVLLTPVTASLPARDNARTLGETDRRRRRGIRNAPLPKPEVRSRAVTVRLTIREREILADECRKMNVELGEWLRVCWLNVGASAESGLDGRDLERLRSHADQFNATMAQMNREAKVLKRTRLSNPAGVEVVNDLIKSMLDSIAGLLATRSAK